MSAKSLTIYFHNMMHDLIHLGFFSFDTDGVSVMEGDSVTLHTGVRMKQKEKIRWYFNHTAIARILGDRGKICTDVQCNNGTERFKGRLKLDRKTGSLTIRDIRTTDSGLYDLLINRVHRRHSSISNTKIFIVAVHDEMKRKSVKEGESVTLDTHVTKNPNNSITWYFNDILIAKKITGDQSKICTDVECEDGAERFRGRLKLNHQTGSLTIMNTRTTDSGDYKLQIRSSRFSIIRSFSVSAYNFMMILKKYICLLSHMCPVPSAAIYFPLLSSQGGRFCHFTH
uniref:Ig-like domain-containing protein n=1 Tax=Sinocyclocheilus anshuiensis TaxID=1608454 RepID=A0A671R154_9TELE